MLPLRAAQHRVRLRRKQPWQPDARSSVHPPDDAIGGPRDASRSPRSSGPLPDASARDVSFPIVVYNRFYKKLSRWIRTSARPSQRRLWNNVGLRRASGEALSSAQRSLVTAFLLSSHDLTEEEVGLARSLASGARRGVLRNPKGKRGGRSHACLLTYNGPVGCGSLADVSA